MNQLTDQQLYNLMPESISAQHDAALLQYGRAVIEAEHKRLMGVGIKPYGYEFSEATYMDGDVRGRGWKSQCFSHYNPSNERGMVADVVPLYSEDQLAAARLQATEQANARANKSWAYMCEKMVNAARLQDKQRIAELEANLKRATAAMAESGYSACDMATAAAQGFRDGQTWLPIETAPKDGAWVLMVGGTCDDESFDHAQRVVSAQWTNHLNGRTGEMYGRWQFSWHDGGYDGEYKNPTHWMPLPPKPE